MQGFSFSDRSFGNDCRMMLFLVLASFRGQTKKDEGERDEKSGMVFYGESSAERLDFNNIVKTTRPSKSNVLLKIIGKFPSKLFDRWACSKLKGKVEELVLLLFCVRPFL